LSEHPYLTAEAASYVLKSCRTRLQARAQGVRYLASALIFLGLLGTLWGLSETIILISKGLSDLPQQVAEERFFSLIKDHLSKPLLGMGVAFSSSLFGLSGSLTLTFIELQLEKAQDSFYYKMEEWVGAITKTGPSLQGGLKSSGLDTHTLTAFLSQWMEGADKLQRLYLTYEKRQQDFYTALMGLTEKTNQLGDLMKAQHAILNKWADEQTHTRHTLEAVGKKMHDISIKGDEPLKEYLNQLSVTCREILKKISYDQGEVADVIRSEVKVLGQILGRK
jgi:hypothetical protein